jgi:hypothetical protein
MPLKALLVIVHEDHIVVGVIVGVVGLGVIELDNVVD